MGNSLLLSKTFQRLGRGAQMLYLAAALESGGKQEIKFTHGTARKFGFSATTFDRYLRELFAAGFLEKVEPPDMERYAPLVLKFSNNWKSGSPNWGG